MKEESKVANSNFKHISVLTNELIEFIKQIPKNHKEASWMIDATLGGGGHSALVLETFPEMNVIGIDQDPTAIDAASQKLKDFGHRSEINHVNFKKFDPLEKVEVVFADLGVSSPQLDQASRGFSFRIDGPLDMRMNPSKGIKAAELIAQLNEFDLANLIYEYGEEKLSRRIAKRIKNDLSTKGDYSGTLDLAYAIAGCFPAKARYGRIHPATRTFQALRIAVNNELDALKSLLEKGPEWLKPNGLFIIISFHSLEDRMVKNCFLTNKSLIRLTKKPIIANATEVSNNPRSSSAKLRVARKK